MSINHNSNGIGTKTDLRNPSILFEELFSVEQKMKNLYERASRLFNHNNEVSFLQLANFQELLDTQIADGVNITRLPLPVNLGLFFHCVFQRQSELGPHKHDCHEIITVDKGGVIDMENGLIFHPGEEYLIKPGQVHNIKSLNATATIYVLFTRDAPN